MKKLVLDLDAIEVTSVDTGGASCAPGTVHANAPTRIPCDTFPNTVMDNSCEMSCAPGCTSLGNTCEGSCDPSCTCPGELITIAETCLC